MKKFFKGLLWIIAVIILVICAIAVYQLMVSDNDESSSFISSGESTITDSVQERTIAENTEIPSETAGGNAEYVQYSYFRVTVSEDRYFTENGEVTLDELIEEVSVLSENYVVEIIDDNATLKAYESLTDMLYEISVPYMEEDGEIHT
ncbi:MAG: hypothetical protein K2J47_00065 [Ruminococcus sp.]|nr:hypothetical protein [Ruminococcus sp.]